MHDYRVWYLLTLEKYIIIFNRLTNRRVQVLVLKDGTSVFQHILRQDIEMIPQGLKSSSNPFGRDINFRKVKTKAYKIEC